MIGRILEAALLLLSGAIAGRADMAPHYGWGSHHRAQPCAAVRIHSVDSALNGSFSRTSRRKASTSKEKKPSPSNDMMASKGRPRRNWPVIIVGYFNTARKSI